LPDHQSRRFFVADVVGSVFIYSSEGELQLLHTITYNRENFVKTLCFDPLRNMLFSGSNQGIVVIYEIGRTGKVFLKEFFKILTYFQGKIQYYHWII